MPIQKIYTLKQHPLSAAWPAMSEQEYQSLKDSIEVIGVQNPITLFEGMVIDGWHRYRAATGLGMDCPSKALGDTDPVDFVKSQNDARRNVTASQRALAITAIYAWHPVGANKYSGRVPGTLPQKTNAELAAIAGTSIKTIKQAKVVHAATPEVQDAVRNGTLSVKKGAATVKPPVTKPPVTTPSVEPIVKEQEPPEYSALDDALDQIQELQSRLAIGFMDGTPEDKAQSSDLIASLRAQVRSLEINLEAVTRSRDQLQNECAALKKQCVSQQNKLKRLKDGH